VSSESFSAYLLPLMLSLGASVSLILFFATANFVYLVLTVSFAVPLASYTLVLRRARRVRVAEAPAVRPAAAGRYSLLDAKSVSEDVFVGISREDGGLRYVVMEPDLDRELYERVRGFLIDELTLDLKEVRDLGRAEEFLKAKVLEAVKRHGVKVDEGALRSLIYYFRRDFLYLGKIQPLMLDDMIEDISCDGVGVPVYVWHREYESIPTNIVFETAEELNSFITKLAYRAGQHISISNPIVDGSLPDGSRVHLTYSSEVTRRGGTFTIRKFRAEPLTIVDLLLYRTLSPDVAAYLWLAVERGFSMLVIGGTASGKTTTLNCLSMFIRPGLKIVTIEDTPELNLPHENWISAVSRVPFGGAKAGEVTLFDLLKASLRQRPDVIIVGEVRGEEAYTLFQAIATGHGGFSTIHSDSIEGAIERLSTKPMDVPKSLIAASLDIAILQLKLKWGEKYVRKVVQVSEVVSYDPKSDSIAFNEVFRWDASRDEFTFSGRSHVFEEMGKKFGISVEKVMEEFEMRKAILEWMALKKIRSYRDVSAVIREFYSNPEALYRKAKVELELV